MTSIFICLCADEDFAIPPPRPKRKPSKPYPRKDGLSSSGLTGTSQRQASSQLPATSQLPPGLQSALQQHLFMQQPQHGQQQDLMFQQQHPAQQPPYGLPQSMGLDGLLHNFDSLTTASSLGSGHQLPQAPVQPQLQAQQQTQQQLGEVTDATVAAVTAAASAAAAAAAAAVVAAAGQEVQMHLQAHPPSCFPFFGLPPSAFAQLSPVAPALDQAVVAAEQAAAATAAAYRFGGSAAEAAAAAPAKAAANAAAADEDDMAVDEEGEGGDKNLVEATGTTDGTHISANAQLRGSDGDRCVAVAWCSCWFYPSGFGFMTHLTCRSSTLVSGMGLACVCCSSCVFCTCGRMLLSTCRAGSRDCARV